MIFIFSNQSKKMKKQRHDHYENTQSGLDLIYEFKDLH
jgi:hypothetical protein